MTDARAAAAQAAPKAARNAAGQMPRKTARKAGLKPALKPPQLALLKDLRDALAARADPVRAPGMQRYMKSEMPYLGLTAPVLSSTCRVVFARHPLTTFAAWRGAVLTLWRDARVREHRYAAIALTGHRAYDAYQRLSALPIYREMIVTGAWWDYVDVIATNRLFTLLRRHPAEMKRTLRAWSRADAMWLRRSAILCQLKARRDTDLALLYACIEPSMDSPEFFLRKGIGWALREYAKTDAREALRYVTENRTRLSPLTKREALKAALRTGALRAVP